MVDSFLRSKRLRVAKGIFRLMEYPNELTGEKPGQSAPQNVTVEKEMDWDRSREGEEKGGLP